MHSHAERGKENNKYGEMQKLAPPSGKFMANDAGEKFIGIGIAKLAG